MNSIGSQSTSKNARHARRPRSVETSTAVCEGVHRESRPRPRRSLRGRIRPVPIVPASEGARNICKRGRTETTHEAREQRTNQQSKSKEAQMNHQAITVTIRRHRVSAPRRDAARDTIIRPIAIRILRGSIARMEDRIFTRARQHRYKNIIESRGDSTIVFY